MNGAGQAVPLFDVGQEGPAATRVPRPLFERCVLAVDQRAAEAGVGVDNRVSIGTSRRTSGSP